MIDYQVEYQGKRVKITMLDGTERVGILLENYNPNIYKLMTKVSIIVIPKKIVRKIERYAR